MLLIRLYLVCHRCIICHHDTHNHIWKERFEFRLNEKFQNPLPLGPGRNQAFVLRNNIMGVRFFFIVEHGLLFWRRMYYEIIEYFNLLQCSISRYWPSNVVLITVSALVLVFETFFVGSVCMVPCKRCHVGESAARWLFVVFWEPMTSKDTAT